MIPENSKKIEIRIWADLHITSDDDLTTEKGKEMFDQEVRKEIKKATGQLYSYLKNSDFEFAYDTEGSYEYKKIKNDD